MRLQLPLAGLSTLLLIAFGCSSAVPADQTPQPAAPGPALEAAPAKHASEPAVESVAKAEEPKPTPTVLPLEPLTAEQKAALAAIREEPAPPNLMYSTHFLVSNEDEHPLWYETIKDRGGIYAGVGADQSFVFAGWAKSEYLVLVDFDRWVCDLNEIHGLVFELAEKPEDILGFWEYKNQSKTRAAVKERWTEPEEQKRKLRVLSSARADVKKQFERLQKRYQRTKLPYFGNDEAQLAHIKKLFAQGRVRAVRGDLTGPDTMQDLAKFAKAVNRPLRLLYLSNAEDYFDYKDRNFAANIKAQYFDDKSLILQTRPKQGEYFWYVAQQPENYIGWMDSGMVPNWLMLFRRYAKLPDGANPETHERVIPPPPTKAKKCLEEEVPGMKCIPGGGFERGSRRFKREQPIDNIWLSTFYMDTYEVTNEAYDACVKRGDCEEAETKYEDFSRPKQPKVGATWYQAQAFCKANGKQLPSEAQWEKAARTDDGRRYPWGDEAADCSRAVIKTKAGRSCGMKKVGARPDVGRTFEVGSKPPNPYGLYDMSGNAWEWVADWYSSSYATCGQACKGIDPTGPCGGGEPCRGRLEKVVRGGSWYWDYMHASATFRHHHFPKNDPYHHYGFRCGASYEQAQALVSKK